MCKTITIRKDADTQCFTIPIRRDLGLSAEYMARMLQVSTKTINRWEENEHIPENLNHDRLLRITKIKEIIKLGLEVYTPKGLRNFLFEPQPGLSYKKPYDLILSGEYDTVISALVDDLEGVGL